MCITEMSKYRKGNNGWNIRVSLFGGEGTYSEYVAFSAHDGSRQKAYEWAVKREAELKANAKTSLFYNGVLLVHSTRSNTGYLGVSNNARNKRILTHWPVFNGPRANACRCYSVERTYDEALQECVELRRKGMIKLIKDTLGIDESEALYLYVKYAAVVEQRKKEGVVDGC